jgi:hypothetical protein
MQKTVRVEMTDGLGLPSGFVSPASYTCVIYYRLPEDWLAGQELLPDKREAMLEAMYGSNWRRGNDDGSYFVVYSFVERLLTAEEEEERGWLRHQTGEKDFQYWYYRVSDSGQLSKVTRDEF